MRLGWMRGALAGGLIAAGCADLDQAATGVPPGDDGSGSAAAGTEAEGGSATSSTDEDDDGTPGSASASAEGSTGPGVADSTGPASEDSGSPSEGSSGDGASSGDESPMAGPHDGAYAGTMTADFTVDGVGSGVCAGTMMLGVSEGAAPEVTGAGDCSVTIQGFTLDVLMQAEGEVVSPDASGTLSSEINFEPVMTTWSGAFAGDTMSATFAGVFFQGSYQVGYAGSWTVTR